MKAAVALAAMVVLVAGCSSPGLGGGAGNDATVSADYNSSGGNAFLPAAVTVAKGRTVTWTMDNVEPHTVDFAEPDSDGPSGVGQTFSGNLDAGSSYEVTFTAEGTYEYYCLYHSSVVEGKRVGMVGTVTVQ